LYSKKSFIVKEQDSNDFHFESSCIEGGDRTKDETGFINSITYIAP
jgi:hypothetical protein